MGLYLTLKPELVQVAVTQIITHFHNNAIKLIWWIYKNYRAVNERRIKDIKTEISSIAITQTPGCNMVELNNNVKRLWQLCNQYRNPTTDLYEKVKLAYMQLANTPNWLGFVEAQNKLSLSFNAYLSAAEDKYIWRKLNKSWMYNESETSYIPKKSRTEVSDDTISMPEIQQFSKSN